MSIHASITRGFAICLPSGSVIGRTYRETAEEAKRVIFPDGDRFNFWQEKEREGYSIRPVVAVIDHAENPTS